MTTADLMMIAQFQLGPMPGAKVLAVWMRGTGYFVTVHEAGVEVAWLAFNSAAYAFEYVTDVLPGFIEEFAAPLIASESAKS